MVFRQETKYKNNFEACAWIYYKARRTILLYKFGSAEKQLDAYCKQTYNQPLKYVCFRLISNCSVNADSRGTVITFKDDKLDRLARLITHGNGRLYGSDILKAALC